MGEFEPGVHVDRERRGGIEASRQLVVDEGDRNAHVASRGMGETQLFPRSVQVTRGGLHGHAPPSGLHLEAAPPDQHDLGRHAMIRAPTSGPGRPCTERS
ncbi:hypothetical protein AB0C28_02820 [Nonomuraea sp. NPDC048892]|uniref:hypothetical protein n=1 Tax=Nonomuraea sp. NPDC048892 TaxID=3154624 RepID=UPI0033E0521E